MLIIGIDPGVLGGICAYRPSTLNKPFIRSWRIPLITTKKHKAVAFAVTLTHVKNSAARKRPAYDFDKLMAILREAVAYAKKNEPVVIVCEQPQVRFTDSRVGIRSNGFGAGMLEVMFYFLGAKPLQKFTHRKTGSKVVEVGLHYCFVCSNSWRTPTVGKGKDKAASLRLCRKQFPHHPLPLVCDEARAEAILIAKYVYDTWLNPRLNLIKFV